MRAVPGVEAVMSVVGYIYIDAVPSSNTAHFNIRLKPYEQRTKPSENVVEIIAALRPQLAAITKAREAAASSVAVWPRCASSTYWKPPAVPRPCTGVRL